MHWNRVREDIATLAEGAYRSVLQWAISTRSPHQVNKSDDEASPSADAESGYETSHEHDVPHVAFARMIQRIMDGKTPELDWIAKWVETHGEDASLAFMAQWERISREIVDEMMSERRDGPRRRSRKTRAVLNRWERAAETISEGIVNVMMDASDSTKKNKARYTEPKEP